MCLTGQEKLRVSKSWMGLIRTTSQDLVHKRIYAYGSTFYRILLGHLFILVYVSLIISETMGHYL